MDLRRLQLFNNGLGDFAILSNEDLLGFGVDDVLGSFLTREEIIGNLFMEFSFFGKDFLFIIEII